MPGTCQRLGIRRQILFTIVRDPTAYSGRQISRKKVPFNVEMLRVSVKQYGSHRPGLKCWLGFLAPG